MDDMDLQMVVAKVLLVLAVGFAIMGWGIFLGFW